MLTPPHCRTQASLMESWWWRTGPIEISSTIPFPSRSQGTATAPHFSSQSNRAFQGSLTRWRSQGFATSSHAHIRDRLMYRQGIKALHWTWGFFRRVVVVQEGLTGFRLGCEPRRSAYSKSRSAVFPPCILERYGYAEACICYLLVGKILRKSRLVVLSSSQF